MSGPGGGPGTWVRGPGGGVGGPAGRGGVASCSGTLAIGRNGGGAAPPAGPGSGVGKAICSCAGTIPATTSRQAMASGPVCRMAMILRDFPPFEVPSCSRERSGDAFLREGLLLWALSWRACSDKVKSRIWGKQRSSPGGRRQSNHRLAEVFTFRGDFSDGPGLCRWILDHSLAACGLAGKTARLSRKRRGRGGYLPMAYSASKPRR